jgi:glutaredoxin
MEQITNAEFSSLNNIIHNGLYGIKKTYIDKKRDYATGKNAGYCPRMAYLNSKMENEVTLEALPLVTASMGKAYEDIMLKSLQEQGTLFGYDLTLNNNTFPVPHLNFYGTIDAVVKDDNEKLFVVDFKTKNSVDDDTKATPADIAQLSSYCALTGLPGSLIYLSRKVNESYNTIGYKVVQLDIDYKHILHIMFFSSLCIRNNILPPKPKNFKKTVHCSYCSFLPFCYEDKEIPFAYNNVTKEAYEESEKYAIDYFTNIDEHRERFINKVKSNELRGYYFKSLEERN